MKKKFKIKKGTKDEYQIRDEISGWINTKICDKYFDEKKGHYVNEIQADVEIEINLKTKK